MNNYKMNYAKKFHYMLKYFILSIPIIFLIFEFVLSVTSISSTDYVINFNGQLDPSNYLSYSTLFNVSYSLGTSSSIVSQTFIDYCTGSFNAWYYDFLTIFNLNSYIDSYDLFSLVLSIPIWILNVYMFDIVIDFLLLLPKLAHRLMNKLGGERYD